MADDNNQSVSTKTNEALLRVEQLDLTKALWGGTPTMREAGTTYLPQHEAELDADWTVRKDQSFLFNMFKRAARFLAGKPFSKPLVVPEAFPNERDDWISDIDNSGTSLAQFARRVFEKAICDGFRFIIVDVPKAVVPEGRDELTAAEEEEQGIRPYLVEVDARQFLGGRVSRQGGRDVITQFRYAENTREPDGEFGEKLVRRVRVLEPGRVRVYKATMESDGGEGATKWALESDDPTSLDIVPVIPIIPDPVSAFTGVSPLIDLAYVNVEHWQSSSDQRNILHNARVPLKFGAGFGDNDNLVVGPNVVVTNPKTDAKLTYVEHSGRAIASGKEDIQHLENRGRVLGLNLITERPSVEVTATEIDATKGETDSELAAMTRDFAGDLGTALDYMLMWVGDEPTDEPVTLHTNFALPARQAADIEGLRKARADRQITQATFLNELKRREWLVDDLDVEAEIAATEGEEAAMLEEIGRAEAEAAAKQQQGAAPPEEQ